MDKFQTVILPWIIISAVIIGMAGLLIWKRRKFDEETTRILQEKEAGKSGDQSPQSKEAEPPEDHGKLGMLIGMGVGVGIAMIFSKQYGQTVILYGLAFGMIIGTAVGKCFKQK